MLFTEIIKDNKIFLHAFRSGRYVSCGFLTVYFVKNKLPVNRFGISVGKKQGGAVQRNRIKRIFRAGCRLCETEMPIGYDLVFAARNDACEKTSTDVVRFIRKRVIPAINDYGSGKNVNSRNAKKK